MPGGSKKGGGLEVGSAYKMKYKKSSFPFKSSPAKHDKSAGGHSKKYKKHTNADHPDYWKAGKDGEKSESEMDLHSEKGDVHPDQQKGYKSELVPGTGTKHKYIYKKKK